MFDAAILDIIGGAVGTVAKILVAAGVRGRWATIGTFALSAFVLVIYGVSQPQPFTRLQVWPYFLAYVNVLGFAAGAFHIIENVDVLDSAVKKMTGTGDGQ